MTRPEDLLALFERPALAGQQAVARRAQWRGRGIELRTALPSAPPSVDWPSMRRLEPGADLVVSIAPTPRGRLTFAQWLVDLASRDLPECSLTPTSVGAAGLHRMWCIAAARIALPGQVRVIARHDLIGIRLAQLALGFGADVLSGPVHDDRKLPLAGVTRPDETTIAGLSTLVEQAGFTPLWSPAPVTATTPSVSEEAR